jgi:hypothetical protein
MWVSQYLYDEAVLNVGVPIFVILITYIEPSIRFMIYLKFEPEISSL